MRVKVRFSGEEGQAPIVLDLRFLPRIGERLQLGFRRMVEVLEVQRVDNDNRWGGIIRARYVEERRQASAPQPPPRPIMPMPPMPVRSISTTPPPAPAPAPVPVPAAAAVYADLSIEELAAHARGPKPDPAF